MIEGTFLFGGTRFALGAALHLPSLAATELERKGTFSQEALAEAERFALTEYLTTLAGPPPKGEAARDFYKRVAEISGLPERSSPDRAASSATPTSRTCAPPRARSSAATMRPSRSPIRIPRANRRAGPIRCSTECCAPMAARSAAYARDELGFKTEMTYMLLSAEVNRTWDWGDGTVRVDRQRQRRSAGAAGARVRRSDCWSPTATATW